MASRALKDLTVSDYWKMKERLKYDHFIAAELYIHINTLDKWKRAKGIYIYRKSKWTIDTNSEGGIKMKCDKCGGRMVYSSEYIVMFDGVEVELLKCKNCGIEKPVKEKLNA